MGRKKIEEEIIEYAKELFLTPDEAGNHKYSFRKIATELQRHFNINIHYATIQRWSERFGWEKLWNEGIRYGITEAIAKQESDKSKEEQLKEQIAKIKRDKTIMDMNIMILAYKFIIENGFTSIQEALKAYETAGKNLQASDIIGRLGEDVNIIIAKELLPESFDED